MPKVPVFCVVNTTVWRGATSTKSIKGRSPSRILSTYSTSTWRGLTSVWISEDTQSKGPELCDSTWAPHDTTLLHYVLTLYGNIWQCVTAHVIPGAALGPSGGGFAWTCRQVYSVYSDVRFGVLVECWCQNQIEPIRTQCIRSIRWSSMILSVHWAIQWAQVTGILATRFLKWQMSKCLCLQWAPVVIQRDATCHQFNWLSTTAS